ncbi:MAG: PAS domain S-box protein [Candidatus Omnitrophota bacterium]
MATALRVLMVEDSENDATLIAHEIRRGGYDPVTMRVQTAQEMREALIKEKWDIVVSDYVMPSFDGLSAYRVLKEMKIDLPFIVVSGSIGEDIAVDAMKAGVHDYIMKNNLARLVPAIRREIRDAAIRWEQKMDELIIDELASYPQRYPNPIVEVEPGGVIHYMNPKARQLFPTIMQEGFAHPFLSGIDVIWSEFSHFEGIGYEREIKVSNVFYHQSIYYINSSKNVRIYALDITKRKETEKELEESEIRYRTLIETSPDAIVLTDLQARVLFGNKSMIDMHGLTSEQELIGLPLEVFMAQGEWPPVWERMQHAADAKGPVMIEYKMRVRDGRCIPAELRVALVRDENNRPKAYIGIARDISERVKARSDLEQAFTRLSETQFQLIQTTKMATMGLLASSIAHEISNPLTGVLSSVQMLKMDAEEKHLADADCRRLMDSAEDSANRCKNIVQSLLSFAASPQGKFQPLQLNLIVDKALFLLERELYNDNIELVKELKPAMPDIAGDPQLLQQVIFDLAVNALWAVAKEHPDGGGRITVNTDYDEEKKQVVFTMSDNGIGIEKENIDKVFTSFFTTKPSGTGTGLGLAIAADIIKSHQGQISADSSGKGSVFTIRLPARN